MDKVKVVAISDIHGLQGRFKDLPAGDLLVIAGDLTSMGTIREIGAFGNWIKTIRDNYDKVIVIAGNHDQLMETNSNMAKELLGDVIYLQDSSFEYKGKKIYGAPWTRIFNNWFFMKKDYDLATIWENIPDNLDLLITHGPPMGILDLCPAQNGFGLVHAGDHVLMNAVLNKKPKNHIFGHIHEGYGVLDNGTTVFRNVSSFNGLIKGHYGYRPEVIPVVFYI